MSVGDIATVVVAVALLALSLSFGLAHVIGSVVDQVKERASDRKVLDMVLRYRGSTPENEREFWVPLLDRAREHYERKLERSLLQRLLHRDDPTLQHAVPYSGYMSLWEARRIANDYGGAIVAGGPTSFRPASLLRDSRAAIQRAFYVSAEALVRTGEFPDVLSNLSGAYAQLNTSVPDHEALSPDDSHKVLWETLGRDALSPEISAKPWAINGLLIDLELMVALSNFIDVCRAIALRPEDASAFSHRATLYSELGYNDAALDDYTRSLRLRPDDPSTRRNRASAISVSTATPRRFWITYTSVHYSCAWTTQHARQPWDLQTP